MGCSKNCGPGQQGRKRICMPYQHAELREALENGAFTCHEKDQKQSQPCSHGPCDSVGWTKNKKTGRFEDAGQKHEKTYQYPEVESTKEERIERKSSKEIKARNDNEHDSLE